MIENRQCNRNRKEPGLEAGFARVDITPPFGVKLRGYYIERLADGVLDPMELNCVALRCGESTALVITVDTCGIQRHYSELAKDAIVKETAIERDSILIHSTHSHTAAELKIKNENNDRHIPNELGIQYSYYTIAKFAQVARMALEDLQPAVLGFAVSKAENIGFNRRYLMKDGSVQTNPGVNHPDIVKSIGLLDERVNVLRFKRADGSNIVLANYGNHPDTIGGNKISGDWPALTRRIFEKAVDNTKCIFLNGCQGDINHVNAKPPKGYMNGMLMDFDNVPRGYSHAIHMGNVVAGAVMQVYEKVEYVDDMDLKFIQKEIEIPLNKPTPEEMPEARRIHELHMAGRDDELPYKGMMLTTKVAEAGRKIRMEHALDVSNMLISIIKLGKIAIVGLPGEPFAGVGMEIKKTEGYDLILPCCCVNAYEGYFPMMDSYEEGGYEAGSSPFKAGCAELLIDKSKEILEELQA